MVATHYVHADDIGKDIGGAVCAYGEYAHRLANSLNALGSRREAAVVAKALRCEAVLQDDFIKACICNYFFRELSSQIAEGAE